MSRVTLCLGWGMRRLTATISFMTACPHFEKRKRLHYCPLEGAGNFSNPEDHLSACHQDLPPSSGPCALARPPAKGLSGKEAACQCRRHRFDPWVKKIP